MFSLGSDCYYNAIGIAIAVFVSVIAFFKWKFTFWEKHGVPNLPPVIPFGNMKNLFIDRKTMGKIIQELYNQAKARELNKHVGVYAATKPIYIPIDPDLIKNILQKDFVHFMNHGFFVNEEDDPLQAHLFNLEDSRWKNMRAKLTPTFTSGKMKMMFQTLADCSHGLKDIMDQCYLDKEPIDVKEILGRFTTDIIGSAAFGISCNSLKDPEAEFRKFGRKVFEVDTLIKFKIILLQTMPNELLKFFRLKITPPEVEQFFMNIVRETVKYRETKNIFRKDFMHLLIQLKNLGKVTDDGTLMANGTNEEGLSFNQLAAQSFVFFIAGFETSSTLMTFTLLELAQNPEIQKKLRNEINATLAKHNNELTYDCVKDMKYLEQVLHEALRKHPPIPFLPRECSKDYTIPELSAHIPKGTRVMIPVMGLHYDPEYYPEPEKFDPERFSEENKSTRHPCVWLPFGEGPRICIGLRFGILQSKVGIITLLRNYEVSLNKKTSLPIEYDRNSFVLTTEGGVWLDVDKISN